MATMPSWRPTSGTTGSWGGEVALQDTDIQKQFMAGQDAMKIQKQKQEGDLAMLGAQDRLRQQQLQRIMPLFQQLSGGMGGVVGGANTGAPPITVGGVYTDAQQQALVNQARAKNDQQTGGEIRSQMAGIAGRGGNPMGIGGMALQNQANQANRANNADAETKIRTTIAPLNADHLLATEQARSNQWQQANQLDVERRRAQQQGILSLFQSLGSFGG